MDKFAVREYFINKAGYLPVPQDVVEKLDKLTVFSDDNKQLYMKPFWDGFDKVIGTNLINSVEAYIEWKQHLDELDIIVAIQTWAKDTWKKGIKKIDINKLIVAYILIDRLFLFPDVDLVWDFDEDTKECLRNYLKSIPNRLTINISIDNLERASYTDQKYYNDYIAALGKKDHHGIFTFLSALAHGIGFNTQFDYFIKVTAKLSVIVDPCIFAENLSKFPPYVVWYYLMYLSPRQIAETLITYDVPDPLPLLIGIIQIVNPQGNNQIDDKLFDDNKLIEESSQIVTKIAQRIRTANIYNYITDCSNIFMNELWHCIFSVFIAKNFQYHHHYLDAIDFSHNTGEYFFKGFIAYNIDDLDNFSCKIYDNYFHSLIGKHSNRFIHFTSYFQFLSQAIFVLSDKSHKKYLENLEQVSIELKRGIYSWKREEWDMLFTKWVLWLLSSKDFFEQPVIDRDTLKTTYELINDIRITDTLQMDSASLTKLLENPGQTGSIALPVADSYDDKKTVIRWDFSKAKTDVEEDKTTLNGQTLDYME